jgi:hypothetical protein
MSRPVLFLANRVTRPVVILSNAVQARVGLWTLTCRWLLTSSLVRPSTFMSSRICLGVATCEPPNWFRAFTKRRCNSGLQHRRCLRDMAPVLQPIGWGVSNAEHSPQDKRYVEVTYYSVFLATLWSSQSFTDCCYEKMAPVLRDRLDVNLTWN